MIDVARMGLGTVSLGSGLSLASAIPAQADFAGAYIGTHIGGNFPEIDVTGDFDNPDTTSYTLNPDDWTAGFQAGYNLPMSGVILGVEGTVSFGSGKDTRDVVSPGIPGQDDDFASYVFKDTITLTGRVGLPLTPHILPYMKAGIAWPDVEGVAADTDGDPSVLDVNDLAVFDGWESGYVIGGGIEVLWAANWSVRAEYEYMDFGDATSPTSTGIVSPPTSSTMRSRSA
jgi:outer membrane immunogenic protein